MRVYDKNVIIIWKWRIAPAKSHECFGAPNNPNQKRYEKLRCIIMWKSRYGFCLRHENRRNPENHENPEWFSYQYYHMSKTYFLHFHIKKIDNMSAAALVYISALWWFLFFIFILFQKFASRPFELIIFFLSQIPLKLLLGQLQDSAVGKFSFFTYI